MPYDVVKIIAAMIWNTRKDNTVWAVNTVPQTSFIISNITSFIISNIISPGTLQQDDEDRLDEYAEFNAGGWNLFPRIPAGSGPRSVYDLKYNEIK